MDEKLMAVAIRLVDNLRHVDPREDDPCGEYKCKFCGGKKYTACEEEVIEVDEDGADIVWEHEYEVEDHYPDCALNQFTELANTIGLMRRGLTQTSLTDQLEACLE